MIYSPRMLAMFVNVTFSQILLRAGGTGERYYSTDSTRRCRGVAAATAPRAATLRHLTS